MDGIYQEGNVEYGAKRAGYAGKKVVIAQDGSCFSVDPVMPLKEQPCLLVTCSGKPSLLTRLLVLPGLFSHVWGLLAAS